MAAIYKGLNCDWCGTTEEFTFIVQSVQDPSDKVVRPLQSTSDKTEKLCFACLESAYYTVFEHVTYDSDTMQTSTTVDPGQVVHWEVNGLKKDTARPNKPHLRLV